MADVVSGRLLLFDQPIATDMSGHHTPAGVDSGDPAYVENPVTGERFRFHTPPEDPTADPLVLDLWAEPEMKPLATHVHPVQDETFTVEEGSLVLTVDGVTTRLEEGGTETVPAGTPHQWRTGGEQPLHLTVGFDPGLNTEAFLRDLATLARRGEVRDDGAPGPLQIAVLYDVYGYDLIHLASPPLPVQKVAFTLLAPLGKALGYRAEPVVGRET